MLTTDANSLDLLEVKSGFFGTNLLAYWPQGFKPVVGFVTDFGQIRFSNNTASSTEASEAVTVYVQRTNGSEGIVRCGVYQLTGTADESDYLTNYTLLEWPHGNTDLKAVTIVLTNDTAIEDAEDFTIYLSDVVNATMTAYTSVTATITSEDAYGSIRFTNSTFTGTEVGQVASIFVQRTNGISGVITTFVYMVEGTATDPEDYTNAAVELVWADQDGDMKTFDIGITDDAEC